jgi:sigma-B regulation protein RsbU (phosphoserine phosphatase)
MRLRRNLLAILLMLSACSLLRGQTFDLTTHAEPLADLNKATWRFHPGDDPRWADPSFDDSQWPLLSGRKSWDSQGYKGLLGFGWYRIHVTLPPAQPVAFSGQMCNQYEAFADGRKIGVWGPMGPGSIPTTSHDNWSTVAPIPQHGGEVVLAVRVWWWPPSECQYGGFDGGHLLLGSPGEVGKGLSVRKSSWLIRGSAESVIALLYILAGGLALMLYGKDRSSKEYLWFGVFTVMTGLLSICDLVTSNWIFVSFRWDQLAVWLPYDVPHIALILFFFYFIGRPVARFARWVIYLEIGFMLFDLVESATFFVNFTAWSFISTMSEALCYSTVAWLAFAYWKQSRSARRLAVPLLLLAVAKIAYDASSVTYFAGLTAHLLPPIVVDPVLFRQTDVASVLFLGAVAYVLIERFAETQAERTRLHGEFEAARTVQQVLIPDFLPPVAGLVVESAYLPAQEVGGDFFQVLPIPDGAAFIVVGDVSGKGLKAAMTVSLIVGTLRTYAEFYTSPAELLAGLNRRLHGRYAGFATCLVLKITPSGDVTIANAGHPNPYLDGLEVSTDSNLPLGITLDVTYAEAHLHIDPTQSFTLVTDGVVEATAATTRELFGFDRTQAISRKAANAIAEAARAFGIGAPQADDITVLTVARV